MTIAEPFRILLLEGIHPGAKKALENEGFFVDLLPAALQDAELVEKAKEFNVLGIRSKTQLTASVLEQLPSLCVIGAFCIGTNQIALDVANRLGVPVFNAPYANTRSVAEMVLAEMVVLARRLGDRNLKAHRQEWDKSASQSFEVRGKTLGIVGYGHIGSQLSILAEALGLKVIFYDIVKKLPLGNAQPVSSLGELLKESDFVSFHVPETPQTRGMIQKKHIQMMKPGAYLINASRGTVIDIPSLADGLSSGHLAGAAIDVFPQEPGSNKEPFTSELQGLSNVFLTPHIGGSTQEAQESIGQEVAESLTKFLKQGSSLGAVNFPHVELPPQGEAKRILNIHRNVPGVLGEINSIVSGAGANIQGQFLSTDPQIGYLVMDLEAKMVKPVVEKISKLETSLRTRVV